MEKNIVILEGFHACKHALRFNAEITDLVTNNREMLVDMLDGYASDIKEQVLDSVRLVDEQEFQDYSNVTIRTPLAGRAKIPKTVVFDMDNSQPIVLLENPRDLENIGAIVRLAAGINAAGVVATGDVDPWHKNCLRGSQGLHFALPVIHQTEPITADRRPMYVFDESGKDLIGTDIPQNAVLVFGSERQGVSQKMLDKADVIVKIPQQEKVSSYNLATSVAMGLYHTLYNKN